MRKILPTLLASALFGVGALAMTGAALAADPATTSSSTDWAARRAAAQQRFFAKLDANHDGVVSRAEYQAWVDGRFDQLDTKGTGSVDAAEIAASPAVAARVQKRAEAFVKRYDTTGTGRVSKADFEAKQMARFDRLSGGAETMTEAQFAAALSAARHQRARRGEDSAPTPAGGG